MPMRNYHTFPETSWQAALIQKVTGRPTTRADKPWGRMATPITKRLYLSDVYTARIPGNLRRLGITHVVSAMEADVSESFDRGVLVMHVPIKDSPSTDLSMWFDRVVDFIGRALDSNRNHKVLVRCTCAMKSGYIDISDRYIVRKAYHGLPSSYVRIWWLQPTCALSRLLGMCKQSVLSLLQTSGFVTSLCYGHTIWNRRKDGGREKLSLTHFGHGEWVIDEKSPRARR